MLSGQFHVYLPNLGYIIPNQETELYRILFAMNQSRLVSCPSSVFVPFTTPVELPTLHVKNEVVTTEDVKIEKVIEEVIKTENVKLEELVVKTEEVKADVQPTTSRNTGKLKFDNQSEISKPAAILQQPIVFVDDQVENEVNNKADQADLEINDYECRGCGDLISQGVYCRPCFSDLPICLNDCGRRSDHESGICHTCFKESGDPCIQCYVNNTNYDSGLCSDCFWINKNSNKNSKQSSTTKKTCLLYTSPSPRD